MSELQYRFLADVVLALHLAIVAFVVLGLVTIVVGNLLRWRPVNNLWFRLTHVGAITVVVLESWFDVVCPLTLLEMWLRVKAGATAYNGGFMEHWLQQLLYYEAPEWVFVMCYSLFGLMVAAAWWYFPPETSEGKKKG